MTAPARPWLDPRDRRALRARVALALGLIVLVAALVRASTLAEVHGGGGWQLTDGDSYYHLRRVEQTLARGGRLPMFDPELAHPHGMPLQWHGGYDLPLAGLVALVCGRAPERGCLETTAAWSTPVLGTAGVALVYALGAAAAGPAVGLLTALLFAVYPWSAGSARLGGVDHHVLEPLLPALWLVLLARRRSALVAIAWAYALAAVPSALAPILATVAAALGAQLLMRLWPAHRVASRSDWPALQQPPTAPIELATSLTLATALTIPLVLVSPFAASFDVDGLSLLHLCVLALAASLAYALERAMRASRAATLRALAASLVVVAVSGAVMWPTLARFSASAGLWGEVAQLRPLALDFTGYALCTLVSLGLCAYGLVRARSLGAPLLALLALLQPLTFLPGVVQMRYLMPASAPFAVMLAFFLADGSSELRRRMRSERPRAQLLAALVSIATLVLALMPATHTMRRRPPPPEWPRALVRVLTRGRELAAVHGRGALLADWRFGHHALYFADLPVVASPFMLIGGARPDRPDPNLAARRALLSATPAELLAAMGALDCRYLLVSEPFDVAVSARSLGRSAPRRVTARELLDGTLATPPELELLAEEPTARLYVHTSTP